MTTPRIGPVALFDSLAAHYHEHFAVPHRRAYDDLAWTLATAALPRPPAVVVDLGCGVGRWAARLLPLGYQVIGVEPAPAMAEHAAAALRQWEGAGFTLLRCSAEELALEAGSVDAVLAMGSLQYVSDPGAALRRIGGWLRPGGMVAVLVDSLHALALELVAAGRAEEALQRVATRRGVWRLDELEADLELFDVASLRAAFAAADLEVTQAAGLLVGASAYGRDGLTQRLVEDYDAALDSELRLAQVPELADLGKQLLMVGRRPTTAAR